MKKLERVFNKEGERDFIHNLVCNNIALVQFMMRLYRDSPSLGKLTYGVTDKNWNYIISNRWADVYILVHELGVNTFLDLGSGLGVGMFVCRGIGKTLGHREIQWNGIERYQELVDAAERSQIHTRCKDILDLTKKDIEKYDCIHMYEPATERDSAEKMVNHVVSILSPHQTILMVSTGNMAHFFDNHPLITRHNNKTYSVNIYTLAEKQTPRAGKAVASSGQTRRRATAVHQQVARVQK